MVNVIIALETVSILILLIVINACVFENVGKSRKAMVLAALAAVGVFGTAFDMVGFIVSGKPENSLIMCVTNCIALISAAWFGVSYDWYILEYIRDKGFQLRRYYYLAGVWGVLATVFAVIGTVTGSIFSIDQGAFIAGPLYFVYMGTVLMTGLYSIFLVAYFHKVVTLHDAVALLSYVAAPIITTVLEMFFEGLSISFVGLSVAILILYILIQSGEVRESKLMEEAAQRQAKDRADFLARFSHEIRTPINAVIGLDELILRETQEEETTGYAKDILSAGQTLITIVNDILDSSRLESGRVDVVESSYETVKLFNDIYNMLANRAKAKDLELRLDMDPQIPVSLYGDEVKLKQIITNVLTNAVKYTQKGSVTWSIKVEDIWQQEEVDTDLNGVDGYISEVTPNKRIKLRVSVQDTGIGIRKEDMEKLFKPFERLDEKKNRTVEGTGLGMFITQSFLELMGSRLEVTSEYGKGSCFSFVIEQGVTSEKVIGDFQEAVKKYHSKKHEYQVSFTAPEAKLLIVDDTPLNIKLTQRLLSGTKIQCDSASSGMEALTKCAAQKYDTILMDHMMPGMDGVETLARIRAEQSCEVNHDTPVIVLTANVSDGARESLLASGFTDYLMKPVDPILLEKMVGYYLPNELIEQEAM